MCVICLWGLFIIPNQEKIHSTSMIAFQELITGVAKESCEEMDSKIEKYKDDSIKVLAISPIKVKSKLLFFPNINSDPNIWPNTSLAEYYGKEAIYCSTSLNIILKEKYLKKEKYKCSFLIKDFYI